MFLWRSLDYRLIGRWLEHLANTQGRTLTSAPLLPSKRPGKSVIPTNLPPHS